MNNYSACWNTHPLTPFVDFYHLHAVYHNLPMPVYITTTYLPNHQSLQFHFPCIVQSQFLAFKLINFFQSVNCSSSSKSLALQRQAQTMLFTGQFMVFNRFPLNIYRQYISSNAKVQCPHRKLTYLFYLPQRDVRLRWPCLQFVIQISICKAYLS